MTDVDEDEAAAAGWTVYPVEDDEHEADEEQVPIVHPTWCTRPEEEDEHEAHIGEPYVMELEDGGSLTTRVFCGWYEGAEDWLQLTLQDWEGVTATVSLSQELLQVIEGKFWDARAMMDDMHVQ